MKSNRSSSYRPGRPYYYANMDFSDDAELKLWDKFYAIVGNLCYREMIGLARALNVSYVTVWRWKICQTTPRYGTMIRVIEWGEHGKPLVTKQNKASLGSML